jgi:cytochrome c6
MTKIHSSFVQMLFVGLVSLVSCSQAGHVTKMPPGKEAFERHCHVCHPKGGNVITPSKTLQKKDMERNGVLTMADIAGKMRNPGPAMRKFDEKTIPENTAQAIAEYILQTFK